ncbi:MAG TPA: c-type cytochrome [Spongiibacteraceae bacterium]|jgi:cytochrome c5|nr:c-type cytochrome [Spongiibacteraceae bacterium]HUH38797.1 c-type cytochrome [Spongiibacteraceae bacterium]
MKKTLFLLVFGLFALPTLATDQAVIDRYNKTCIACHSSGAAGAPRTGDAEAWAPRLAKGMDELLKSTHNGLRGMPPKGLCFDCTDDEYRALIEYMSTPAK